jgi:hypothetical protein
MMSAAFRMSHIYEKRMFNARGDLTFGLDAGYSGAHLGRMLNTAEILKALKERGVKQKEIAAVLCVTQPRVSALYKTDRKLTVEEAIKLVDRFNLDDEPPSIPLNEQFLELAALAAARRLGLENVDYEDPRLKVAAQDILALVLADQDPRFGGSLEALRGFLLGRLSVDETEQAPAEAS